jgi:bifunctional non-homologous end joining protein LigD
VFDLRGCALLDRKRVLHALLEGVKGPIKFSDHTEESGPVIYREACKFELEGVVSKRVDGKYESGRTKVWMKTTCRLRETFVVAGWAEKNGRFDGLYLGREQKRKLVYAGKLERGFTAADQDRILEQLRRLKTRTQPITAPRKFPKAQWVKPHAWSTPSFAAGRARACCATRRSKGCGAT